jgi:hypothetical protein
MKDYVRPRELFVDNLTLQDVRLYEAVSTDRFLSSLTCALNSSTLDVNSVVVEQAIDGPYRMAISDERLREMAPNEPGTTRD